MVVTAPASTAAVRTASPHIVDELIAERAPRLSATPWWPLVRPLLYRLLNYFRARRMADAVAPLGGREALDYVSGLLALHVDHSGLERMPATGRCVVICNHPTGIADGLAVYDVLKTVRTDLVYYANADARRVCPRLDEVLIPVEWVEGKKTRERTRITLKASQAAFEAERALIVFPAGRIARYDRAERALRDPAWQPSALSLARKYDAPVVPIHVQGPWSTLFHLFNRFSPELRDITLFHELLNKRGRAFSVRVGPVIPTAALGPDMAAATEALKHYVEIDLAADPNAVFVTPR